MEDIFQNMMTKKPIAFILRGTGKLRPHKSFCKERANIITNLNYSKLN